MRNSSKGSSQRAGSCEWDTACRRASISARSIRPSIWRRYRRYVDSARAAARHRDRRERRPSIRRPARAGSSSRRSSTTSPGTIPIVQEEIFGPVLAVQIVDDFDEAVAAANCTQYGLVAGIFTRDLVQGAPLRAPGRCRAGLRQRVFRRRHRDAVRRQPQVRHRPREGADRRLPATARPSRSRSASDGLAQGSALRRRHCSDSDGPPEWSCHFVENGSVSGPCRS